jgi:hypothetical protein
MTSSPAVIKAISFPTSLVIPAISARASFCTLGTLRTFGSFRAFRAFRAFRTLGTIALPATLFMSVTPGIAIFSFALTIVAT